MNAQILKRFNSAVKDLNNFISDGGIEFSEPIEMEGDLEIVTANLDGEEIVEVTPKQSIWGRAYVGHRFRFDLCNLSDEVGERICQALESEFSERAAWWDQPE